MKTKTNVTKKIDQSRVIKRKELKIIGCFQYIGITGREFLSIEIYDKKTKKMFVGNIESSNWTLKDKLNHLKEAGVQPLE